MEIFAGTIKDSLTKSEVNPFQLKTVPNWILDRFSRTIGKISTQNESGSFPLDCWLSPLFGERKSISDQAPISLDIGLLYFQFNIWKFNSSSIYELFFLNLWDKNKFSFIQSQALSRDQKIFLQYHLYNHIIWYISILTDFWMKSRN